MDKVLVHMCCAPCATWVCEKMRKEGFEPIFFFYNPNIFPKEEYDRRLENALKLSKIMNFELIVGEWDNEEWDSKIRGYEKEPEGGKRCKICFEIRLRKTAEKCKELGIKKFTTTLTISPHKNAKVIFEVGERIAKEYSLSFLSYDFKKEDGFKKSVELSKKFSLYRQRYCGCKYSMR